MSSSGRLVIASLVFGGDPADPYRAPRFAIYLVEICTFLRIEDLTRIRYTIRSDPTRHGTFGLSCVPVAVYKMLIYTPHRNPPSNRSCKPYRHYLLPLSLSPWGRHWRVTSFFLPGYKPRRCPVCEVTPSLVPPAELLESSSLQRSLPEPCLDCCTCSELALLEFVVRVCATTQSCQSRAPVCSVQELLRIYLADVVRERVACCGLSKFESWPSPTPQPALPSRRARW